jgi:hypothetical protein
MKRFIAFFAASLFSAIGLGQASFGIIAGLNIANQSLKVTESGFTGRGSGNSIPAFQIGGFADLPLGNNFNFLPELLLSGEGSNFNDDITSGTLKIRPYYLRIPLDFAYEANIHSGGKFIIGTGPEFGYGLFGNFSEGVSSTKVFQDSLFKRFDFGLSFMTGVELKSGVRFRFNYYLGLSSIASSTFTTLIAGSSPDVTDFKWYNRVISLSIGYVINKK